MSEKPGVINEAKSVKNIKFDRAYLQIDELDFFVIDPSKREGEDFVVLNEKTFNYLKNIYSCEIEIKRTSIAALKDED